MIELTGQTGGGGGPAPQNQTRCEFSGEVCAPVSLEFFEVDQKALCCEKRDFVVSACIKPFRYSVGRRGRLEEVAHTDHGLIALAVAALLSGDTQQAAQFAKEWCDAL